jgi:Holliday junction resolvase RusA-like endonuclease
VGRVFRIEFPAGTRLLSANGRSSTVAVSTANRFARMTVTASLRELAARLARDAQVPALRKVAIRVSYFPPDRRRRDSSNITFPSSKPCIDGFTDAGVLPDDNDTVVASLTLLPGMSAGKPQLVPGGQLVIEIEELEGNQ